MVACFWGGPKYEIEACDWSSLRFLLETNGCKSFEGPKIYLCTSLAPLEALRAKRTGGGAPRARSPCTAAPVRAQHPYSGGTARFFGYRPRFAKSAV